MSYFSTTIFNMSKDGPRDTEIPKIRKNQFQSFTIYQSQIM